MDSKGNRIGNLRPRFSILSLGLTTTIVALAVGMWLSSRQHNAEKTSWAAEQKLLMSQLNHLDNVDKTKVVAKRIGKGNPHIRRWKIYLPSSKKWRLNLFSGLVPAPGYNIETATNNRNGHRIISVDLQSDAPAEGIELEAGIYNHNNRGWILQVEGPKNVIPNGVVRAKLSASAAEFWKANGNGAPYLKAVESTSRKPALVPTNQSTYGERSGSTE
jgi:hypothetical protein